MAYTTFVEVVAAGSAGSNTISISFPYIRKEDVKAYVDGTERPFSTLVWPSSGQVRLPDTDGSLAGKTILVRRETPISNPEATFAAGGLDQSDLNLITLQSLYADQEQKDQFELQKVRADATLAAMDGRVTDIETNLVPVAEEAVEAAQTAATAANEAKVGAEQALDAVTGIAASKLGTAQNLSDLTNVSAARGNLGLGDSATRNVGTGAGTVAAGNDSRIVGAAPLASPALTGTPTAPTAALGTNTAQIATMAALQAAIAQVINGAPGALDTVAELAAALGNDPNFATTIINGLSGKAAKSANLSDLTNFAAARSNIGAFASAGGTLTGNATISPASGAAFVTLNKPASGQNNVLLGQTNGSHRWLFELGDGVAESGSNAGSDFKISRWDDAGNFLGYPLQISRATGNATLTGRWLHHRAAGTGGTFSPDFEQNVTESFSAGAGFYIPFAVLSTKTGGSGHREAVHVEQISSASSVGEFVVAIQGQGRITAGSGSAFGLNGYVWVDSGAAATVEAGAGEFNTDVRRAVVRKVGVQIVDVNTSSGSGTVIDCGAYFAKQAGGVGFSTGIQFGHDTASFPIFAGGKLLFAATPSVTLAAGADFSAIGTPTVAAFVAPAGANGLAFGTGFGGGLIRSSTNTGGPILTFHDGVTQISSPIRAMGYQSLSGTTGSFTSNYINFHWNVSTGKVDLYVDNVRIGAITTS